MKLILCLSLVLSLSLHAEPPPPLGKTTPLFELNNILVPIDFSDCSKKALAYALPYAREFGANITLLYVARFDYAASEMDSSEAPVLEGAHLERAKKELQFL